MKKILLVLIALMGIGFGAKAQSCDVGDNTYVGVDASVKSNKIVCTANYYGDNIPKSGMVYVTCYYINTNGEEDSEMITIQWNDAKNGRLGVREYGTYRVQWGGHAQNVKSIRRWEVSAGACRIETN